MPLVLEISIGAFVALILLMVLFRVEEARGDRILLGNMRDWADRQVVRLEQIGSYVVVHYVIGTLRIWFHALIHGVIVVFRLVLRKLESWLHYWQHRNRTVVRNIRSSARESHLSSIAEHKATTTLTDAEKRELKDRHLEG